MLTADSTTKMKSISCKRCICSFHDELQSYFYDNTKLLQLFHSQLAQYTDDDTFLSLCQKIENLDARKATLEHTFETPSVPDLSSLMFQEDDWTKRLCRIA